MSSRVDLLLLQLADSAFPSGGFAHSGGLEAAFQQGAIDGVHGLRSFIDASLVQGGRAAMPYVLAACRQPQRLAELDGRVDAMLSNHVANRASRAQGWSFLKAAQSAFAFASLEDMQLEIRRSGMRGHLSPVYGAACARLGLGAEQAASLFLYIILRGLLSAGVRLGIVGPLEAQALQFEQSGKLAAVAGQCADTAVGDAAQTSPIIDLLQMNQDRLYSRLFQS